MFDDIGGPVSDDGVVVVQAMLSYSHRFFTSSHLDIGSAGPVEIVTTGTGYLSLKV